MSPRGEQAHQQPRADVPGPSEQVRLRDGQRVVDRLALMILIAIIVSQCGPRSTGPCSSNISLNSCTTSAGPLSVRQVMVACQRMILLQPLSLSSMPGLLPLAACGMLFHCVQLALRASMSGAVGNLTGSAGPTRIGGL